MTETKNFLFHQDWSVFQQHMRSCQAMQMRTGTIPPVTASTLHYRGKEYRAQLVFLTAQLLGSIAPQHHDLACAIESLHTASLLHDDVLDDGQMRRGAVCPHKIYGNTMAILSGDWWLAHAFSMLVQVQNWDVVSCVQEAMMQLVQGQMSDCQMKTSAALSTKSSYLTMIGDKTACLFSTAAFAASLLSHASSAQSQALKNYGAALGMAYQLRDDAAEYSMPVEYWDAGHDFLQEKITFPWIVLQEKLHSWIENSENSSQEMWKEKWQKILDIQYMVREKIYKDGAMIKLNPFQDGCKSWNKMNAIKKWKNEWIDETKNTEKIVKLDAPTTADKKNAHTIRPSMNFTTSPSMHGSIHVLLEYVREFFQSGVHETHRVADDYCAKAQQELLSCWKFSEIQALHHWNSQWSST